MSLRTIVVDDEAIALENMAEKLARIDEVGSVELFLSAEESLDYLENNCADLAFLDITMRGMDGMALAQRIQDMQPSCAIVFLTGYSEYAVDAFKLKVHGYLLKPVAIEDISREIESLGLERPESRLLRVQTFGGFEVYANGAPVHFLRAKSKELFAFLIDRNGTSVTNAQVAAVLWEDRLYNRSLQKITQTIIGDMVKSLAQSGAEGVIVRHRNQLAVDTSLIDCDYFRLLKGDPAAKENFTGRYMDDYSWAELTLASLQQG